MASILKKTFSYIFSRPKIDVFIKNIYLWLDFFRNALSPGPISLKGINFTSSMDKYSHVQ